jgi:hypothetical protein
MGLHRPLAHPMAEECMSAAYRRCLAGTASKSHAIQGFANHLDARTTQPISCNH